MTGYYSDNLAAERLKRCYEIAPPRVRQYLQAEINHVARHIRQADAVLELGCGYGRVLSELARWAALVIGIDNSLASLKLARKELSDLSHCHLACMDAARLAFRDGSFDVVACIQNGISAFHVDRRQLLRESVRVTRPGGTILFSSYSERFWEDRLAWFELQSDAGLLGEIDYDSTRDGVIVCKDGFRATTVSAQEFMALASGLNVDTQMVEVDQSSLFCEIRRR